ncbi:hypothetical protein ACQP2T_63510 (plasmid) [Nonomuraea sp. CA-143628]|uniref:hypothetical protein n=1 Tax=Nonomuraea sp. CA-143628 TaxID=3239997 RepID=UPI003D920053
METERTTVTDANGREIYVYPNGDRFYADEVHAMLAGAEERRKQPLKVDDLDELRAKLERLKAEKAAKDRLISPTGSEES